LAACRPELAEAVQRERRRVGEIADVRDIDADPPRVGRQPLRRRDANLAAVAIPLRPGRGLAVRKIKRPDDGAALPTAVRGLA